MLIEIELACEMCKKFPQEKVDFRVMSGFNIKK
jgi:hypothetical protein